MKGSRTAVSGSGMSTMSDSWMLFQPAMDEPSNILPSSKNPSSTTLAGTLTCCSFPRVSVKRRSTNFTSFSAIVFNTSSADISGILLWSMGLRFRRGERYEAASGCTLRASPSDPGPRSAFSAPLLAGGCSRDSRYPTRKLHRFTAAGADPTVFVGTCIHTSTAIAPGSRCRITLRQSDLHGIGSPLVGRASRRRNPTSHQVTSRPAVRTRTEGRGNPSQGHGRWRVAPKQCNN